MNIPRLTTKRMKNRLRGLSYRPQIESLEKRVLLSTDTWIGGGPDNNWHRQELGYRYIRAWA